MNIRAPAMPCPIPTPTQSYEDGALKRKNRSPVSFAAVSVKVRLAEFWAKWYVEEARWAAIAAVDVWSATSATVSGLKKGLIMIFNVMGMRLVEGVIVHNMEY